VVKLETTFPRIFSELFTNKAWLTEKLTQFRKENVRKWLLLFEGYSGRDGDGYGGFLFALSPCLAFLLLLC
jgi:hypothetical protein